jgi:hypothetical protein
MCLAPECDPRTHELVRFLLGFLPDEETELLDEASIVDDHVAAELRVVESDLVDAYVRDALPDNLRRRFESFYLTSPSRRAKVMLARKFVGAIDRAVTPDLHSERTPGQHCCRPKPNGTAPKIA